MKDAKLNNLLGMDQFSEQEFLGKKAKSTKRTEVAKDVLQENAYVLGKDVLGDKLKNKEIGVIAYTGGDVLECPVPNDFLPTVNDRNWHCYLNGINDAIDLRLDKFFKKYSDSIYTSPPLYLLKNEI